MSFKNKIHSSKSLARILEKERGKSKKKPLKIVFTNGCFDILHKGHVTYLERARAQGTHLVVAVNSDSSVRKLKGPERPINPLADRLEVIAALESVSYVTWFEEDTPTQTLITLKPDVLVKGGDWKASQIVGADEVKSWGGKVRSLNFVKGKSTTAIIERSQKK